MDGSWRRRLKYHAKGRPGWSRTGWADPGEGQKQDRGGAQKRGGAHGAKARRGARRKSRVEATSRRERIAKKWVAKPREADLMSTLRAKRANSPELHALPTQRLDPRPTDFGHQRTNFKKIGSSFETTRTDRKDQL